MMLRCCCIRGNFRRRYLASCMGRHGCSHALQQVCSYSCEGTIRKNSASVRWDRGVHACDEIMRHLGDRRRIACDDLKHAFHIRVKCYHPYPAIDLFFFTIFTMTSSANLGIGVVDGSLRFYTHRTTLANSCICRDHSLSL